MYIFFDTETSGLPINYTAKITDVENWPRLVQLGWILYSEDQQKLNEQEFIVFPDGFTISEEVSLVHGITQERAIAEGWPLQTVIACFLEDLIKADTVVCHNFSYDASVMGAELVRAKNDTDVLTKKSQICTMKLSTEFCKIPGKNGHYKWPRLEELYKKLFSEPVPQAHTALADAQSTARCYFELKRLGVIV